MGETAHSTLVGGQRADRVVLCLDLALAVDGVGRLAWRGGWVGGWVGELSWVVGEERRGMDRRVGKEKSELVGKRGDEWVSR